MVHLTHFFPIAYYTPNLVELFNNFCEAFPLRLHPPSLFSAIAVMFGELGDDVVQEESRHTKEEHGSQQLHGGSPPVQK